MAAYLLVLIIGFKLLADWGLNSNWASFGWRGNEHWALQYVEWLRTNWIWPPHADPGHQPHLLDFHDLRRPEAILFWLSMVAAFAIGFLPQKRSQARADRRIHGNAGLNRASGRPLWRCLTCRASCLASLRTGFPAAYESEVDRPSSSRTRPATLQWVNTLRTPPHHLTANRYAPTASQRDGGIASGSVAP